MMVTIKVRNRVIIFAVALLVVIQLSSCSVVHLKIRDALNKGEATNFEGNILYATDPWERAMEYECVAHLRFVEKVPHFSEEKRAEYVFEVVEWLKGGNGEERVSVYSPYYKLSYSYSLMEASEADGRKYEVGKEYLLPFSVSDSGVYITTWHYFPLYDDMLKAVSHNGYCGYWEMFVSVAYPEGVETLSKEEFLNCIRSAFNDPEVFKAAAKEIQTERDRPVEDETIA